MNLAASHDRSITYLRLSITDRCNLRCRYCMPAEGVTPLDHQDILTFEEITRLSRLLAANGVHKIRITGGEPLVRKGVVSLVSSLKQIDGVKEVALTTNGLLLNNYASALKDAGLDRLNISLDTLQPKRYQLLTRTGSLGQFWQGVEAAQKAGFTRLKFNCVAMKGFNHDELGDIALLAKDNSWQMRFIEYMPMGGQVSSGNWQAGYLPYQEIQQLIVQQWEESATNLKGSDLSSWVQQESKRGTTARVYDVPGFAGTLGFISPIGQHFCHECNRLRLAANGNLFACLLEDGKIDLRTLLRSGASDETILAAIERAASLKPEQHSVDIAKDIDDVKKKMSRVGG